MVSRLTQSSVRLLREVLANRAPDLLPCIPDHGRLRLGDEQRLRVSQSLAEELVAKGLGDNDEPNEHGRRIESLIDDVNRVRG